MQLHDPGRHNWVFWNSYAGVLHRIDTSLTCMRGDNGVQLHLHNGKNVALGDIQHFRAPWPKKCVFVKAAFELFPFWGSEIGDRPCRLTGRTKLSGIGCHCSDAGKWTPLCAMNAIHQGTGYRTPYAKLLCKKVSKTPA